MNRTFSHVACLALCGCLAVSSVAFAASVPVANHSFENAGLAVGGWSDCIDVACGGVDPENWINPDAGGVSNTNTAFTEVIGGFAADGTHHVGIDTDIPGLEVAQNLGIPVFPLSTYTLTVAVGNRNANFTVPESVSQIALYAGNPASFGGTQLAAATYAPGIELGESQFADVTLVWTSSSVVPAGDMWISLQNVGVLPGGAAAGRAHFDNVRLDVQEIPEPSSLALSAFALSMIGGLAWRRSRRKAG